MRGAVAIVVVVVGATASPAQREDWLVGAPTPPATVTTEPGPTSNSRVIRLANGLVERLFTVTADGGLCTTEYRNVVSGQTYFRAISAEANLTLSTEGPACPPSLTPVARVDTVNPTTAREVWPLAAAVSGRVFRFVFGKPVSGYQPFVNELQIKTGGAWRKNSDTANDTAVTGASGSENTPQLGLPWAAFDGNVSSLWDAAPDTEGAFWLDVDFGAKVTFDELALTTQESQVPGQGFYWRPTSVTVLQPTRGGVCHLPYDVGGCTGQPADQNEFWTPDDWGSSIAANPAAFQFRNFSTSAPTALFPWKPGTRHSPRGIAWPPTGVHLELHFGPPVTAPPSLRHVTVTVHYELYTGLPTFRKWVSVKYDAESAASAVTVSSLVMELLRAPNFAPERMTVITQQANNPTPFDQQVKPETDQSFPGRTNQYWHFDPSYDQGDDREIHVTYTYYTFLVVGYGFNTVYFDTGGHNTTGPGAKLSPGETFTSLSVRTVLHDSTDAERQGLGVRQSVMQLAPQVLENPVIFMITNISGYPGPSAPMRLAVTQAAATGHELVIVGFGAAGYCGLCDEQMLNPTWVAWFKAEVAFANSKGIEVSAYTLMQHNGWGETTPPAEQALFHTGRAGVACMATDFHARYRSNVLTFIKETGMGGLETDGQYEDYSCADAAGDHRHNGIDGSYSYQLQTTLDFNVALKGLGVYQTGADAYVFSGANKWNHADTDAFGRLPFWPHLTVGRMYVYDSTMNRVPASGQIGVNDLATSSLSCGKAGTAARVACFDYALASGYTFGTIPSFRAARLWDPADADATVLEATITKWVRFFVDHRDLFVAGHIMHIRRPDSRDYEAVAYVRSAVNVTERALLSVLNPTTEVRAVNVTFPLYYAGFRPGDTVNVTRLPISSRKTSRNWAALHEAAPTSALHTVGGEGAGLYDVVVSCALPPKSYTVYTVAA
mmetsp:Transcript_34143/g.102956  ORF Transcript_34143/g.102956 Transcript_34143/m.102956 type:complete len:948 (-) Transcript_34143:12-2855(-)